MQVKAVIFGVPHGKPHLADQFPKIEHLVEEAKKTATLKDETNINEQEMETGRFPGIAEAAADELKDVETKISWLEAENDRLRADEVAAATRENKVFLDHEAGLFSAGTQTLCIGAQ